MTAAEIKALDRLERAIHSVLLDASILPDGALEATGLTLEASLEACRERVREIIIEVTP